MDGLEGFKILLEGTYIIRSVFWDIVMIIGMFTGTISFITIAILLMDYNFRNKKFNILKVSLIFITSFIIISIGSGTSMSLPQYKVTPIEDKYNIDLNRYEIVAQEGDIFTIRELKK